MASGDELPQAGPAGSLSLSRSVEKALEEAANSGVLNLSNRKLREFPRAATNYDLSDLTQAGESGWGQGAGHLGDGGKGW
ncbi:hypothetical protein chiPu_0026720, partial [Chiloscyllium punctatum]|nr:hypothetical protein [Chiloscyllium punctatum]